MDASALVSAMREASGPLSDAEQRGIEQVEAQLSANAVLERSVDWASVAARIKTLPSGADSTRLVGAVAALCVAWLTEAEQRQQVATSCPPAHLFECVQHLHNLLFAMGSSATGVQRRVCRACELWWSLELANREQLVTHSLPMLLILSLGEDAKKSDVRRVFAARKMLYELDLEEDSSLTLRHLLLRCFLSPLYTCSEEGSKFLSELCWLSTDFIGEIHSTVRAQLPFAAARKEDSPLVSRLAAVYSRAWRGAAQVSAELEDRIERDMIQDLMDAAIHTADASLAQVVLSLLDKAFHEHKHLKDIDAMLLRLYNPILWRSLDAANPTVRLNAVRVLSRCFPLTDPDLSVAENDELLDRQLEAVATLLRDEHASVRVVATQAVARILSVYWEMTPKRHCVKLLSTLVGDLLHDTSSPRVREAVLRGLEHVSENPLSHGALKDLLPHVCPLVHDNSRLVRAALVKLLLRVSQIRSIKFYEVVPVEHLLERLAVDSAIAPKLTKLLLDSFYPQGVPGSEQLQRMLTLVESHPAAAVNFMGSLHCHIGVGQVCKLAVLFGKWVANAVQKGTFDDGDHLCLGVLHGIAQLWASVAGQLGTKRYDAARKLMEDTFCPDSFLEALFGKLDNKLALPPALEIAAQMDCPPAFQAAILAEVAAFSPKASLADVEQSPQVAKDALVHLAEALGPALRCICAWGAEGTLIKDLALALGPCPKKKQRGNRPGPWTRTAVVDPLVALWCLQFVLANDPSGARQRLLQDEKRVADIRSCLSTLRCHHPFAFETLLKLAIHQSAFAQHKGLLEEQTSEDEPSPSKDLVALVDWAAQAVVSKGHSAACDEQGMGEAASASTKRRSAGPPSSGEDYSRRVAAVALLAVSESVALGFLPLPLLSDKLPPLVSNAHLASAAAQRLLHAQ